jgi:hypothetical protein
MMEQVPILDTNIFHEFKYRKHFKGVYPNILMEIIFKATMNGGYINVIGHFANKRIIGKRHDFYYVCLNDKNMIIMIRITEEYENFYLNVE